MIFFASPATCEHAWEAHVWERGSEYCPLCASERPVCRCGSGMYPRRCQAHPQRYQGHCDEISTETNGEA